MNYGQKTTNGSSFNVHRSTGTLTVTEDFIFYLTGGEQMIIDVHAHLNPMEWSHERPAAMFDVEAYVEAQRDTGVDLTVFSNPMIGRLPHLDLRTLDKIRRFHDF